MNRNALLCFATTALVALTAAAPATAQESFSNKPIRIVVNFAAGGPTDSLARLVAEKMATSLKATVIVDNKPGAGGNIGAAEVAKAAPDGHTILLGIDTTFTINPAIYASMPFEADALKPLMILASSGLLVGTTPSLPVKSLGELMTAAKKQPLAFSSAGNGSPGHMAAELFADAAGAKIIHVPYRGNAPAVMAILSAEVQAGILATPGMVPHVKAGKVTPLAVTSSKRSAALPDVPTAAELGHKGLEFEVLQVAMLPAATPAPVVEALRKAMADALDQPDIKAKLAPLDLAIERQAGPAAQARLTELRTRYERIVKATGMKAE